MRSILVFAALLSATLAVSSDLRAAESEAVQGQKVAKPIVLTPELIAAHRNYQQAQLKWRNYRFYKLPQQRKVLDQQVRLAEAEIRVLKRRVRDYRPFLQVGEFSPVRTAAENDRLALLETEQQLKLLRDQRIHLMRAGRQHGELYQLEVLRTAASYLQIANQSQAASKQAMMEEKQ